MSNFHMSKEEFHGRVVECLNSVKTQKQAYDRFTQILSQTAQGDITFQTVEEIEEFLNNTTEFNRTMIQNLKKAAKQRAFARLAGKK